MAINAYQPQPQIPYASDSNRRQPVRKEIIDARTGKPISDDEYKKLSSQMLCAKAPSKKQVNTAVKFIEEWAKKFSQKSHKPLDLNKTADNINHVINMVEPHKNASDDKRRTIIS